jgi:hypothetical protein
VCNYDVSLRMGRAEHTRVTENKCRLRVVIFFYKHPVTPDWVKNRADTSYQMTARFGRPNCTLRKNYHCDSIAVKSNRERKPNTSNYLNVSVCEISIGVTQLYFLQHYYAAF